MIVTQLNLFLFVHTLSWFCNFQKIESGIFQALHLLPCLPCCNQNPEEKISTEKRRLL